MSKRREQLEPTSSLTHPYFSGNNVISMSEQLQPTEVNRPSVKETVTQMREQATTVKVRIAEESTFITEKGADGNWSGDNAGHFLETHALNYLGLSYADIDSLQERLGNDRFHQAGILLIGDISQEDGSHTLVAFGSGITRERKHQIVSPSDRRTDIAFEVDGLSGETSQQAISLLQDATTRTATIHELFDDSFHDVQAGSSAGGPGNFGTVPPQDYELHIQNSFVVEHGQITGTDTQNISLLTSSQNSVNNGNRSVRNMAQEAPQPVPTREQQATPVNSHSSSKRGPERLGEELAQMNELGGGPKTFKEWLKFVGPGGNAARARKLDELQQEKLQQQAAQQVERLETRVNPADTEARDLAERVDAARFIPLESYGQNEALAQDPTLQRLAQETQIALARQIAAELSSRNLIPGSKEYNEARDQMSARVALVYKGDRAIVLTLRGEGYDINDDGKITPKTLTFEEQIKEPQPEGPTTVTTVMPGEFDMGVMVYKAGSGENNPKVTEYRRDGLTAQQEIPAGNTGENTRRLAEDLVANTVHVNCSERSEVFDGANSLLVKTVTVNLEAQPPATVIDRLKLMISAIEAGKTDVTLLQANSAETVLLRQVFAMEFYSPEGQTSSEQVGERPILVLTEQQYNLYQQMSREGRERVAATAGYPVKFGADNFPVVEIENTQVNNLGDRVEQSGDRIRSWVEGEMQEIVDDQNAYLHAVKRGRIVSPRTNTERLILLDPSLTFAAEGGRSADVAMDRLRENVQLAYDAQTGQVEDRKTQREIAQDRLQRTYHLTESERELLRSDDAVTQFEARQRAMTELVNNMFPLDDVARNRMMVEFAEFKLHEGESEQDALKRRRDLGREAGLTDKVMDLLLSKLTDGENAQIAGQRDLLSRLANVNNEEQAAALERDLTEAGITITDTLRKVIEARVQKPIDANGVLAAAMLRFNTRSFSSPEDARFAAEEWARQLDSTHPDVAAVIRALPKMYYAEGQPMTVDAVVANPGSFRVDQLAEMTGLTTQEVMARLFGGQPTSR